ncbi:MAG: DUF1859 domain-containing protein [Patescibacteria group bacterium]|nr:DUF1859 domain-containing protein [Patescibacteria group bacterium]
MSTFAQIQAAINQAQPIAYIGGGRLAPGEKSPYAITCFCDFSASGIPSKGYSIDITKFQQSKYFHVLQCLFIDNSLNNGYVLVNSPLFGQAFALPPGYQGYFPILGAQMSGVPLQVTSTGNQSATVILLNTYFPAMQWPATVTPPSAGSPQAVSDAILDATVYANRVRVSTLQSQITGTDKSGTIAAANTPQLLIAANPNRQKWRLQNIDSALSAEGLWWGYSNTITVGGPGAFELAAASSASFPGGYVEGTESNAIYVVAATLGHKFSASEIA